MSVLSTCPELPSRTIMPLPHAPNRLISDSDTQIERREDGSVYFATRGKKLGGRRYHVYDVVMRDAQLFRPGYARGIALSEMRRAVWLDGLFHPDLPPRSAWPIIQARYEAQAKKANE